MENLKMPSDAQLMQIAIADLNNSSLSLEDRQRALQELLVLVEPIDNANGRCKYLNPKGLAQVVEALVLGFAPFKVQGSTPHGCKLLLGAIGLRVCSLN